MAIFPFADWFYHLSQKQDDLDDEYNTYLKLCETINAGGVKFDHELSTLQEMAVMNYGLIIAAAQTQMSESDYAAFLANNEQLPPPHPSSAAVITAIDATAAMLGLANLGAFLWNLKTALTPAFRSAASTVANSLRSTPQVAPELSESWIELTTERGVQAADEIAITADGADAARAIGSATADAGVQAGSDAGIEAVGSAVADASSAGVSAGLNALGIVAAVGIDAILGAIDGAQQSKELEQAKGRLDKALGVINQFSKKLDDQFTTLQLDIEKQAQAFVASMAALSAIQAPMFAVTNLAPVYANRVQYLVNMRQALTQYGYLTVIRSNWLSYQRNVAQASWSDFAPMALQLRPELMSTDVANKFLAYAKSKLITTTPSAAATGRK